MMIDSSLVTRRRFVATASLAAAMGDLSATRKAEAEVGIAGHHGG